MSRARRRSGARAAGILIFLLGTIGAIAVATAAADERAEAQAELERITAELNELNVWLGGAERKRAAWQREIQASDEAVARLSRDVDAAAEALAAVRSELRELERRRTELDDLRRRQARHIADHLASAWRLGGDDFIKLLLNQQSPATMDRMARYHRYFTAARMQALEDYRTTLAELAATSRQLEQRAADAEARQAALKREQAALVETREERKSLLARLESEAEDKETERQRLVQDRERLASLLRELKRRSQELDGEAFASRKGSLPWPLEGRLANAFGQPRSEGRLVWHGLLVAAEEGTPVTAVARGRVVFSDWLRGFGLLTIVDHGGGYMTLYGQADTLQKKVGDWVEGGEVIARAGRSGGTQVSGLYFEIRHDGRAQDPIVWLNGR